MTHSSAVPPADRDHDAHDDVQRRGGLSLRLKINLMFSAITIIVFAILIAVEITATRSGVREEMEASGRIAAARAGRRLLRRRGPVRAGRFPAHHRPRARQ